MLLQGKKKCTLTILSGRTTKTVNISKWYYISCNYIVIQAWLSCWDCYVNHDYFDAVVNEKMTCLPVESDTFTDREWHVYR